MPNVKQGFGVATGIFDGSTFYALLLGLPVSDNERVITSIHAGYGIITPAGNAFESGRLLIVRGAVSNVRSQIDPHSILTPADITSPVYDLPFDSKVKFLDFGPQGFVLAALAEYTVILTAPATSSDTWPALTPMNGYLNVSGYEKGKEDPFGILR